MKVNELIKRDTRKNTHGTAMSPNSFHISSIPPVFTIGWRIDSSADRPSLTRARAANQPELQHDSILAVAALLSEPSTHGAS